MSVHSTGPGSDGVREILEEMSESVGVYEDLTGEGVERVIVTPYLYTLIQTAANEAMGLGPDAFDVMVVDGIPITAVIDPDLLDREVRHQWEVVA